MDDKALLASENISLKHEVDYLKSRVESIEKFKSYFFKAKTDLVIANTRVSLLESELMITSLKKRMLNKDKDKDKE